MGDPQSRVQGVMGYLGDDGRHVPVVWPQAWVLKVRGGCPKIHFIVQKNDSSNSLKGIGLREGLGIEFPLLKLNKSIDVLSCF